VTKNAGENLHPHLIIYYLRDLAQCFHHFYNEVNILKAEEADQINIMRTLEIVKDVIRSALDLIGIEPLDQM
jgi:arginyl-tRNA synthetase